MVRRWSYINQMNNAHLSGFRLVRKGAFDVNMNSTMYLRKSYALSTKNPRHRWARRKHLYNWIPLANVLKDWAKTYRFYRKYNKFVFNQYFTKNSLLSFNLVSSLNSIPCLHKGSENVVAAPVTRRTLQYFQHLTNPRFRFLIQNKHLSRVIISYDPKYLDLHTEEGHASFVPLYLDKVRTLESHQVTPNEARLNAVLQYTSLTTWGFVTHLLTLKSIYRACVLLTHKRL